MSDLCFPSRKRGFVLLLVITVIFLVSILAFSYHNRAREEAWRAHRVFYNDLLTKAAEGLAEGAFAWFLANPDNEIARNILQPDTGNPYVSLAGILPIQEELEKMEVVVKDFRLTLICDAPFLNPESTTNGFPTGFSGKDSGYLFPDSRERYGLLKVEVEVYTQFKNFSRKYEALREIRSLSLLPGIFGQFTLFVKNKRPLADGDPNHLKMQLGPTSADEFAGYTDPAAKLGNPMVLIHHPKEKGKSRSKSEQTAQNTVSLPWTETIDLENRGWVFLGSTDNSIPVSPTENYPFRFWVFNIFQGRPFGGITHHLPGYRFFGQVFMLPTFGRLIFHTSMPDLNAREIPPSSGLFSNPPFNSDPYGNQFHGIFLVCNRKPFTSAYGRMASNYFVIPPEFKNYYDPARNRFHKNESIDGPLIHLFGDFFPEPGKEAGWICDQRSPTLVLGRTAFRFQQITNSTQMGNTRVGWIPNDLIYFLEKTKALPKREKPPVHRINFFPFIGLTLDPRLPVPRDEFKNDSTWKTFTDPDLGLGGQEYAAVTYSIMWILGYKENLIPFMSKIITPLPAQIFETILQNNMEDELAPSGWIPKPKFLKTIPTTVDALDEEGNVEPIASHKFFFSKESPVFQGDSLLLKDKNGVRLAGGNLSNIWPFSDSTTLDEERFICTSYDLRQKTTHLVTSPEDFKKKFITTEKGKRFLDLQGGIVTVLGGDVTLTGGSAGKAPLYYREGGILIVSNGELHILSGIVRESEAAQGIPLTLATAKTGKHIWITSGTKVEAYLLSSGTLKRRHNEKTGFDVSGGIAVKYMDFSESTESIFYGNPDQKASRFRVTWHPDFNIFDPANRKRAHRFILGPTKSYWKSEPL